MPRALRLPPGSRWGMLTAACALLLAATWLLSTFLAYGRGRDAAALAQYVALDGASVEGLALQVARLASFHDASILGAAATLGALVFRGPRVAVAVMVLLGGATFSTEILKKLASNPKHGATVGASTVPAASWPSGHSTAAMALALAAVIAAPRLVQPLVAGAGAAFAASVSISLLILASHMPSDVLGGFLVAASWAYLVLAVVEFTERRRPRRTRRLRVTFELPGKQGLWFGICALIAFAGLTAAIAIGHGSSLSNVLDHGLLLGTTVSIAAAAVAVTVSVALLSERSTLTTIGSRVARASRPTR
jgi:membrane-associated phospholipid phosphatase